MISLQFAAQNDAASWLIEYYGHGSFSHVDAILPDGSLVGARMKGGVARRQPGYADFSHTLRVDLPCPDPVTVRFYDFIHDQLGKPYDMLGILGFAAGRDWRKADSWFCSELIAAGLEDAGLLVFQLAVQANKITPPDLLLICSTMVKL